MKWYYKNHFGDFHMSSNISTWEKSFKNCVITERAKAYLRTKSVFRQLSVIVLLVTRWVKSIWQVSLMTWSYQHLRTPGSSNISNKLLTLKFLFDACPVALKLTLKGYHFIEFRKYPTVLPKYKHINTISVSWS